MRRSAPGVSSSWSRLQSQAPGGQGTLTIRLRRGALDVFQWQLLGAALLDLDRGYLTVGGENSVGRGRATITALTLNRYPLQKEDLLHALAEVEK